MYGKILRNLGLQKIYKVKDIKAVILKTTYEAENKQNEKVTCLCNLAQSQEKNKQFLRLYFKDESYKI